MNSNTYKYDVFISHAVEDKMSIANDLCELLKQAGLKIWYSGNELGIGDRIEKSIQKGLDQSRFGIVIFSPYYLSKTWTIRELYSLMAKERAGQKVILPVLHNVTIDDLKAKDLTIADTFGISSEKGIEIVAASLISEIRKSKKSASEENENNRLTLGLSFSFPRLIGIILLLLLGFSSFFYLNRDIPSDSLIEQSIEQRIKAFQDKIDNDHLLEMSSSEGRVSTMDEIIKFYARFKDLKAQYRNEYEFTNGFTDVNFKKNVREVLNTDVESLAPVNNYGFNLPAIYLFDYKPSSHIIEVKYALLNTQPIQYAVEKEESTENYKYLVRVAYENNIRYLSVDLTFSKRSDWMKKKRMTVKGFLPKETYVFEKEKDEWVFKGVSGND
ncbi:hypothetical protein C900_00416 [Fulvivirga imtechensis AK7]|uniref:ADP-ribosyl cyclase/cyclic ADP-ribose hydrolase n=1 Tax=Fulvivirga imtechensis AK7 TaxID=1237149 RepID=L8JLJ9_9BACT|nr:toll/interleukin-1 receptor domain-containing protein [Fulvivirga imtechensis]ELR68384.1 hypothetical protein C900_00416 [Fulvivirga imtechensis AK7]